MPEIPSQPPPGALPYYDSIRQAAAALSIPAEILKRAKSGGCTGFRSNRVYTADVFAWLAAHPQEATTPSLKEQKIEEEVRKLRLANDQKEGRLVSRSWVVERVQRAASEVQGARVRSEQTDPLRFQRFCPGADVAGCRVVVREIWDGIMASLAGMARHLAEDDVRVPRGPGRPPKPLPAPAPKGKPAGKRKP